MEYPSSDGLFNILHESRYSDDLLEYLVDKDVRNYFQVMPDDWVKFPNKFKQNLTECYWKRMLDNGEISN